MPNDFTGYESLADSKGFLVEQSEGVALLDNVDAKSVAWKIPHGAQDDCVEWVKKNRLSVTNASFRKCQLKGLWRSSDLKINEAGERQNEVMLIQTFRRGYAATAIDKEAFVSAGDAVKNANGDEFTVTFPTIRPDIVDDVVASLKARPTATNPIFGRTHLTGKYVYSRVRDDVAGDGIHNIVVTLTKVATITSLDDLAALTEQRQNWITILSNGEWENGREEGWELKWTGLDNDSQAVAVALIENAPADFVNRFVTEVLPWTGTAQVGKHYVWDSNGTNDWTQNKRQLVVEARRALTFGDNESEALQKGWVTQSWEPVLPIKWDEAENGTSSMTVRIIWQRWKNIKFGLTPDFDPSAFDVTTAQSNLLGHQAANNRQFTGVPSTAVPALIDSITPTTDHVVGRTEVQQNGTVASVGVAETLTYKYYNDTTVPIDLTLGLTAGVTQVLSYDGNLAGSLLIATVDFYPRIAGGSIAGHITAASNALTTGWVVVKLKKDENPDGSYNLTRWTADSSSTSTAFYWDNRGHEHKRLYRTIDGDEYFVDVLMAVRDKFGFGVPSGLNLYRQKEVSPYDTINPGFAMDGSSFSRVSANLYRFKKVYGMFTIGADGEAETNVTMGSATLEWTKISTTTA